MNEITLKRPIITPRHKIIPAGTVLSFDEHESTTFEDETIFLYRIHALCHDLTKYEGDMDDIPYQDHRDEMLEDGECILYDEGVNGLGELHIVETASTYKCMELAKKFNPNLKWDWLLFKYNSYAVIAENDVDSFFILSDANNLTFRLQTYAFSLLEEELTDTNIGDFIKLEVENAIKSAKLFAFGKGLKWIKKQLAEYPVGRNGKPVETNLAPDTDALHVLCEIEGGQLMILPYGRDFGVEVFASERAYDKIYSHSNMRIAVSYAETLELIAKIERTDINDCKTVLIQYDCGEEYYVDRFNGTEVSVYERTYIPSIEQYVSIERNLNHIKELLSVEDTRNGVSSTITFVPSVAGYYESMRVNPVIRMRTDNIVNRSLGFSTDHTIVCIGEYAYGLLPCKDGFVMGDPGFEMEIDNRAKISDIDFSEMEFAQFKCNTFCFDDEKFDASILDDFDTFSPSLISEADFLKIKPCKDLS